MTVALWAAHMSEVSLVITWPVSPQCPDTFHSNWKHPVLLEGMKVKEIVFVDPEDNAQWWEMKNKGVNMNGDITGYGSFPRLTELLENAIRNILTMRNLTMRSLDNVIPFWSVWQPCHSIQLSAESFVRTLRRNKITHGSDQKLIGIHYRRGDMKKLMQQRAYRLGHNVSYETFDERFKELVTQCLLNKHVIIVATDTREGAAWFLQEFGKYFQTDQIMFGPLSKAAWDPEHCRADASWAVRETSQTAFVQDVVLLSLCDWFVATQESSVRQLVHGLRQIPFQWTEYIGISSRSFELCRGKVSRNCRMILVATECGQCSAL
jgi:hypothetical protein